MTCCHRIFSEKTKEKKVGNKKKGRRKKKVIQFMVNTPGCKLRSLRFFSKNHTS
jgi:hypothetical protein